MSGGKLIEALTVLAVCAFMLCPLPFVLFILAVFRNSPPYTTSVNVQWPRRAGKLLRLNTRITTVFSGSLPPTEVISTFPHQKSQQRGAFSMHNLRSLGNQFTVPIHA